MQAHGSAGAPRPAGAEGGAAAAPTPSKGGVDDAVASLLGLAEASSSEELSQAAPWANWEASGSGPADVVLRRRLTAGDVQRSRLSFPARLFSLLFGAQSGSVGAPLSIALQAAGGSSSNVHTLAAEPAHGGAAMLVAGPPLGQLFDQLGAGLADVVSLRRSGSTQQGTPLAVCSLVESAEPSTRRAAAAAASTAGAAVAGGSSPASPAASPPAGSSGAQPQRQQQQAVSAAGGAAAAAAGGSGDEPAAPSTVRPAAAAPGRPSLDAQTPEAAAASLLAAVADEEARPGSAAAAAAAAAAPDEGVAADPDWMATKPKGRGRPRKRRPASAGGAGRQGDAAPVQCGHCGTGETPRWWNLPTGTLCNACGIWLKRHGYPRPVQFFIPPAVAGAATVPRVAPPAAPQQVEQQQQQQQQPGAGAGPASREPPPDVEYYLINGRPKRRRTAAGSSSSGAAAAAAAAVAAGSGPPAPVPSPTPPPAQLASGGSGEVAAAAAPGAAAAAAAAGAVGAASVLAGADMPINFEAAGSRVFVVRRKLIKAEGSDTPSAALVHFGWAPAARAAHQMFGAVARFAEASRQVSVDDFELLSDCRATATLQLRPGAAPPNWDSLVCSFVDSL